jgi:hypothetical protein
MVGHQDPTATDLLEHIGGDGGAARHRCFVLQAAIGFNLLSGRFGMSD